MVEIEELRSWDEKDDKWFLITPINNRVIWVTFCPHLSTFAQAFIPNHEQKNVWRCVCNISKKKKMGSILKVNEGFHSRLEIEKQKPIFVCALALLCPVRPGGGLSVWLLTVFSFVLPPHFSLFPFAFCPLLLFLFDLISFHRQQCCCCRDQLALPFSLSLSLFFPLSVQPVHTVLPSSVDSSSSSWQRRLYVITIIIIQRGGQWPIR